MADKSKKRVLTFEDKKQLLLTPCKNRDELRRFIKYFLDLELPDIRVSRYANSTPLDSIWEVYQICVLKQNPENIQELLYVAARGSGKSLGAAIAEFLVMLHDRRDVAHIGVIMSQAKRCYDYQQNFYLAPRVKEILTPTDSSGLETIMQKNTMEKSTFNINNETCSIEVLPLTLKAVNGPHVGLAIIDEVDTASGEGLKAFKEISGILDTKRGKKPLRVGISTRKSTYGLMHRMIESAEKEQRTVRTWTALEFTEKCPDSRSSTETAEFYINPSNGDVITPEEFNKKDDQKKKEYELEKGMFAGCYKCPIAPYCRGDAKNQTSTSPMLKTIDELNKKVLSEGHEWAASQLFNLKPSLEGIVFREFDEKIHMRTWNQMWKTLTGKDFPGECTHDVFVKKCHEMGLTNYSGLDFGWSSPSTFISLFADRRDNIYVVRCEGQTYVNDPTWIHHVKMKYHGVYRCQLYFPDIANGSAVDLMKQAGLPVCDKYDKSINLGIQVIKRFLRTPGTGDPKIFFAKDTCGAAKEEFIKYHYKLDAAGIITEDPDDDNNHFIDPLRYIMTMVFGKGSAHIGSTDIDSQQLPMDPNGSFTRAPTPEEFAKANGLVFNDNSHEVKNLGKVGTLNELDDEEKNEEDEANGFLWNFND